MWRRRLTGAAVVLALVATACVRDNPAEPGVRAVTTDLQYKALREQAAAPPNTVPSASLEDDFATVPPFPSGGGLGPVAPHVGVCPTAAPAEQPDEDVPESVTGVPTAGTYLWRVNGGEEVDDFTHDFAEFHRREIDKVKGSAQQEEPDVTFETVERQLSATDPNPPFVRQSFESTAGGVNLTAISREVPDGETHEFNPLEPVLYLPTPVIIGPDDAWESEGIDLLSEPEPQILTHKAYVKGRMTIDSCGERVRAWHVVSRQTFTFGSSSVSRRYEYGVANQLGGLIIYEAVQSPCDEEPVPASSGAAPKCDPDPTFVFEANLGKPLED